MEMEVRPIERASERLLPVPSLIPRIEKHLPIKHRIRDGTSAHVRSVRRRVHEAWEGSLHRRHSSVAGRMHAATIVCYNATVALIGAKLARRQIGASCSGVGDGNERPDTVSLAGADMTRGRNMLKGYESLYDQRPVLLFDWFAWSERGTVLAALRNVLDGKVQGWRFSGAYIFAGKISEGAGQLLYCGEAVDLRNRIAQHLQGGGGGNQFENLEWYFAQYSEHSCCLGLLVVNPRELPWLYPPDEEPVLEDGTEKRAAECLEALLLRAAINLRGELPTFNDRRDEARADHDVDTFRFQSLLRYLLDHPDASQDFVTFRIRSEEVEAQAYLKSIINAIA